MDTAPFGHTGRVAAEFRQRFEATLRWASFIARIFGIDWNPDTGLTDTQVKQLGERAALVRVSVTTGPRVADAAHP